MKKQMISEGLDRRLLRFFSKYNARLEQVENEQQLALQKPDHSIEESNTSWLGIAVTGITLVAGVAAIISWLRPSNPTQIFHHHSGQITDNINLNCSGRVIEDININWPRKWY